MADSREHFQEINALVGAIAKAMDLPDEQVTAELERGAITLSLGEDDNGNRFVEARRGEARAQVYQGAIRHADPPPSAQG